MFNISYMYILTAVVSKLDQSVGEVIDALRNREMLENSIVVFMSDNGAPTEGTLSNQGSNYPLRGCFYILNSVKTLKIFQIKDSPWEGGTRGVAAIWSPLIKKTKRVSNQMMFMSDWLPTLLSAAGVNKKQLGNIDGFDLWPALVSDKISPRSEIVINIDDLSNYAAIRRGDFKYIIGQTETGSAWLGASGNSSEGTSPQYDPYKVLYSKTGIAISAIVTARKAMKLKERKKRDVKTIYDIISKTNSPIQEKTLTIKDISEMRKEAQIKCNIKEKDKTSCEPVIAPCLFDIRNDPCEMVNLAEKRPVILAVLKKILMKHRLSVIPPSNLDGDPRANPLLWNNTWTSWDEPNPLALTYTNAKEFQHNSDSAIVVMSIICGLFVVGVIINSLGSWHLAGMYPEGKDFTSPSLIFHHMCTTFGVLQHR
ncbi:unnamed protein product, partial [Heterotrigona itama]